MEFVDVFRIASNLADITRMRTGHSYVSLSELSEVTRLPLSDLLEKLFPNGYISPLFDVIELIGVENFEEGVYLVIRNLSEYNEFREACEEYGLDMEKLSCNLKELPFLFHKDSLFRKFPSVKKVKEYIFDLQQFLGVANKLFDRVSSSTPQEVNLEIFKEYMEYLKEIYPELFSY